MAIYHFSAQVVKRSEGRNSIAMSAYRSAEKLIDDTTGVIKDYTSKTKVFLAEILAPKNTPSWAKNRQTLWNKVEQSEKRKDAQVAREINVAIPKELTPEQMRNLVTEYVQGQFVSMGMVADVAYHDINGKNPHAHIMLTMREIDGQGFGLKNREWNSKENLLKWREYWGKYANKHLDLAGSEEMLDHRALIDQGVDRTPQIHVGVTKNAKTPSIRKLRNDAIIKENAERSRSQVNGLATNQLPQESISQLQEEIEKIESYIEKELIWKIDNWSWSESYKRAKDKAVDAIKYLGWDNEKLIKEISKGQDFCKKNKWRPWKWDDVVRVGKECNDKIRKYNSNSEKIEDNRLVVGFLATKEELHRTQEKIIAEKERPAREKAEKERKEAMRARWKAQKATLKKSYSNERDDDDLGY